MKKQKRPHLPRGLRWKSDSPYIWFTWRDSRGKQHQQSTGTDDPATAFGFRQQFLEKSKEEVEEIKAQSAEIGSGRSREWQQSTSIGKWQTAPWRLWLGRKGFSSLSRNSSLLTFA
jgi:hypothetical protein